ncbi:2'-5' RNA ligase family protein [Timonella senegalensis]|uniref:2'-5' RNA ligase family protein n=1 Tax=Timonella senegalensis TaxID=1465825 RepID=UPI000304DC47|nr:2'-5' RNA ligase family protein [Timonella senegalensis]
MRLPERVGNQLRIGISISVPDPMGAELQAARRSFGDPLADAIPPHITVVGPTVIEPDDVDDVYAHVAAACLEVPVFRVHLRGSATFRPLSPVVFIQVVDGISQCEKLERLIRTGPLAQDTRFHYHPHVTVAHEVSDENLDLAFEKMAFYETSFDVTHLHLSEHGDDNVWRAVKAFPLGQG